MKNSLRYEFSVMCHKKEFLLAICAMLFFALYSFFYAVELSNVEKDIKWIDFVILSADNYALLDYFMGQGQTFVYLFAFIIVLPHSMSYLNDLESGELPLILVRCGKRRYITSKFLVCFLGNIFIIALPLLINYLFCKIAFPLTPNFMQLGGYGNISYSMSLAGNNFLFTPSYRPSEMLLALFTRSTTLYYLVHIAIVSLASGLFGCMLLGMSFLIKKLRFLLFLPVFLFIRFSSVIKHFCQQTAMENINISVSSVDPMDYFLVTTQAALSPYYLIVLFGVTLILTALFLWMGIKGDRMLMDTGKLKKYR